MVHVTVVYVTATLTMGLTHPRVIMIAVVQILLFLHVLMIAVVMESVYVVFVFVTLVLLTRTAIAQCSPALLRRMVNVILMEFAAVVYVYAAQDL
jgi:hypothetical protein